MGTIKGFHLFAGIRGGIYGGYILDHSCCEAVEIDDYYKEVLEQRQQGGWMNSSPIHGDITNLNGCNFKGAFDILYGGLPCQTFSHIARGQNISEKNLWPEILRLIWESKTPIVLAESVTLNAIRTASMDLESIGYRVKYCKLSCDELDADRGRDRCWLLAIKIPSALSRVNESPERLGKIHMRCWGTPFSELKNEVVTNRGAQLKAIRNAQAPLVVAATFRILVYRHKNQIRNPIKALKKEIDHFFTVRPTWTKDTYGESFGSIRTPTTMANYLAPSIMKHAGCRNFVEIFNRPISVNAKYLVGLPQGASVANSMSKKNMKTWLQKLRQATIQRDLSSEKQLRK